MKIEETRTQIQLSRYSVKRAVIAVSLANLCFISAWQRCIYGQPFYSPLWSQSFLFALVLNITALAAVFYLLLTLSARINVRGYYFDGLVYAIPLFSVSNEIRRAGVLSGHGHLAAISLIAVPSIFGITLFWYQRKLLAVAEFVTIGLVVLFPFNLIRSVLIANRAGTAPSLAVRISVPDRSRPRVIWLIFDEMDFTLSFNRRPANVRIPAFDRLRSEAFFATAAEQPGVATLISMPTLISGRPVFGKPEAQGTRTLLVRFSAQASPADWGAVPSVFSDARAANLNVGIVGWYFPYCRIFSTVASECYSEPMYSGLSDRASFRTIVIDQLDSLTPLESRVRLVQRVHRMITAAESMASDPELGLVLIHLPVPHGPPIFDRDSGKITLFNSREDWFFDNLVLADRVMSEIREGMERSGQWDSSVVIVSSDHSLREEMMPHPDPTPLVPFIIKMPGQTQGRDFNSPFNAEITRELIGRIISGEITAANLPTWIEQHAH